MARLVPPKVLLLPRTILIPELERQVAELVIMILVISMQLLAMILRLKLQGECYFVFLKLHILHEYRCK